MPRVLGEVVAVVALVVAALPVSRVNRDREQAWDKVRDNWLSTGSPFSRISCQYKLLPRRLRRLRRQS